MKIKKCYLDGIENMFIVVDEVHKSYTVTGHTQYNSCEHGCEGACTVYYVATNFDDAYKYVLEHKND